jgi:hypothetical protein
VFAETRTFSVTAEVASYIYLCRLKLWGLRIRGRRLANDNALYQLLPGLASLRVQSVDYRNQFTRDCGVSHNAVWIEVMLDQ